MSPTRLRKQLREIVRKHKDKKCLDCKKRYPQSRMSYDHVSGHKLFNLGGSLLGRTEEEVLAEIAKCEVVCLDCHRNREDRRHFIITG